MRFPRFGNCSLLWESFLSLRRIDGMEHLLPLTKEELAARLIKQDEVIRQQAEFILLLKKEIDALKQGGNTGGSPSKQEPPEWAKANTPKQKPDDTEKPKRKQRAQSFHR